MLSEGERGIDNVFSLKDGMDNPGFNNLCGSIAWSDSMIMSQGS